MPVANPIGTPHRFVDVRARDEIPRICSKQFEKIEFGLRQCNFHAVDTHPTCVRLDSQSIEFEDLALGPARSRISHNPFLPLGCNF